MDSKTKVTATYCGSQHGIITRLISPEELGEQLKPFVFLDYFNAEIRPGFGFPMHPHSGIATLTWQPNTDVAYEDTTGQHGILAAGGLEWLNAGSGAWHKAMLLGSGKARGFQLWVAMPPEVERGPSQGQYVPPDSVAEYVIDGGNVKVLLGKLGSGSKTAASPIQAHQDMNYLVITLEANATWIYQKPAHHDVAFAVGFSGKPSVNGMILESQLAVLEGPGTITITAGAEPAQVLLGTALKHPYPLVLSYSSVHTSKEALAASQQIIRAIGSKLRASGRRDVVEREG